MEKDSSVLTTDESLLSYLSSLDQSTSTLIRLFDREDYYSVHGEDAIFVANDFLKSPDVIKYFGARKVASVAISKLNYEALVRELLLIKQYRVELYAKSGTKWRRTCKGSPGNLSQFEDILFLNNEMVQSAGVLSFVVTPCDTGFLVSMANIDVMMRHISFCEVSDNEQFCMFESILVQIMPKECVVSLKSTTPEGQKLKQILKRMNVIVIDVKVVKSVDSADELDKLLQKEDGVAAQMKSQPKVLGAFSSLIKYLDLMSDSTNLGQFDITQISPDRYMRLDGAAFNGLNIMPQSTTEPKISSLFGLLNHCSTPQGSRLLCQWLKQPLLDLTLITERLDIVQTFVEGSELRQTLQQVLKRVPDFYRIAKKLQRGKGNLQDCYRMYVALKQLPSVVECLSNYDGDSQTLLNCKYISPLREFIEDFSMYFELIETTVDLEQCNRGEYFIKSSFDEDLQEVRDQMTECENDIEDEYSRTAKRLGTEKGKGVKLDVSGTYGHCFRVTRKDEKGLRSDKNFQILQTKKDGVTFTSHKLKEYSDTHKTLKKSYDEKQYDLSQEVIKVASGYTEPIISLNHILAHMDCLLSFSQASLNAPTPYTRPTMLLQGTGQISLAGARHPCVEAGDDIAFISNDVTMSREESSFLIITGPNMGGKSTYIRQIGVVTLLSCIGCFVPCDTATVSIVSSIFARVGAADSQAKGVSTFMAEMLETSAILSSADKDSLIIIDELGRGTSTYDGFGLAWAISNHIVKQISCLAVFATHFHEMTNLVNTHASVKNYHVSALVQAETLTLLYKVDPGPCDQSYGIHVARLAQFPAEVVALAESKASQLDQFQFVPEESEEREFSEARSGVDKLLKQLGKVWGEGKRGEELMEIVNSFKSGHPELFKNPVIRGLVEEAVLETAGS